jgi:histidine triad (HIT) family protein
MPGGQVTEEELSKMSPEEIAELQKQNCIFCKIASKEIPAKIIHEDSDTICILDINPASEGHILVYPKKHYMILPHMPEDVLQKVFKNVKLMSHTLLKSLQCKGTTIFIANGVAAGQKAPHVLVHVFPRREGDGLVNLPNYEVSDEQLEKLQSSLGQYISQVFGRKAPIIKIAEFTDKPKSSAQVKQASTRKEIESEDESGNDEETEATKDGEKDFEDNTEELDEETSNSKEEIIDNNKEVEIKKVAVTRKKPFVSNMESNNKNNTKNTVKEDNTKDTGKINLDDISRLFG